jgi:predicted DNA binding CopG/RHH family protein
MKKSGTVPKFSSEAEEAKWWFEHQSELVAQFEQAEGEGRLHVGLAKKRVLNRTPTTTIRLDPTDIVKARVAAAKRGIRYQTYLKMIIHEALAKEPAA